MAPVLLPLGNVPRFDPQRRPVLVLFHSDIQPFPDVLRGYLQHFARHIGRSYPHPFKGNPNRRHDFSTSSLQRPRSLPNLRQRNLLPTFHVNFTSHPRPPPFHLRVLPDSPSCPFNPDGGVLENVGD